MPKFKTGDLVVYTEERGLAPLSTSAHPGATARVRDPAYSSGGWLQVEWIANPRPEQNPITQNNGGYSDDHFELAKPAGFGLDIKFDNVDDAIKAATHLAKTLGRPVGVIAA